MGLNHSETVYIQVPYTPCYHCVDEVREGSVQSNHSELTSKTSTHLAFSALKWFEKVRGGSRGLNHSETVYIQVPYTPCYHCEDEVREGSVQSNHSELTSKTSTHLAFSALKWFEKVRGGSMGLNHSETVYIQVPYTPCYHCEDEVREGSVQSNHSELTSKTSTHLAFSALKWFEKVRGGSRGLNHSETVYIQVPYTPCYHCEDEVREGSVQSNHSELTSKTSTHLAFSALKWFEEVRGG